MIVDNLVYEVQSKKVLNKCTQQSNSASTLRQNTFSNLEEPTTKICDNVSYLSYWTSSCAGHRPDHTGHRPVLDIVLIAPNCTPTPQHSIAIWHALFNRRRFLTNNISQGAYHTGHRPVLDIVLIAPSNIPPKWNRNRSQQTLLRQAAAARPVLMMKQRLHVACALATATSPHSRPISLSG